MITATTLLIKGFSEFVSAQTSSIDTIVPLHLKQ